MTPDQTIEKAIQAAGATVAPRLTPDDIDAAIVSETYTTLPSGKVMVCELTLLNGFTVRGEASVVSKANFKEEIGRQISRENARSKVWELEGYLLQQRLHERKTAIDAFGAGFVDEMNKMNDLVGVIVEWPEPTGRVLTEADSMADLHGYARPDNPTV